MANQKHLDILKQGPIPWNVWREKKFRIELNLSSAYLRHADLSGANLSSPNLTNAKIGRTIFGDIDLRNVKGLETVRHEGPSTIGIDTIIVSQGKIPETFLRQVVNEVKSGSYTTLVNAELIV